MDWEEGIHSHIQLAITKHVHLYETFANSIILYTKCHYVPKYYHFLFSQTVTVCNMLFWKGSLPDSGYSFTVSHHKNKGGKKKVEYWKSRHIKSKDIGHLLVLA